MTEDQSVVGRKQIYYDQRGGEYLIYSDSDKEVINEEEKIDFTISEDEILRYSLTFNCSLFYCLSFIIY